MDFTGEKVTDPGQSGGEDGFGVAVGLIQRKVVGHKGEIRAWNPNSERAAVETSCSMAPRSCV